jgi:hypothetical protein
MASKSTEQTRCLRLATGILVLASGCGGLVRGSDSTDGGVGGDGVDARDGSSNTDGDTVRDAGEGQCSGRNHGKGCDAAVELDWAQWRMPNSPVDVEGGAPNRESYTDHHDGTVTDNVTGLLWQKESPPRTFTWGCVSDPGTAQAYCATLTLAGHNDWRLPTYIELVSLLDYSRPAVDSQGGAPALNTTYFNPGNASDGVFWSNTHQVESPFGSAPWAVDFYGASPTVYPGAPHFSARCVH